MRADLEGMQETPSRHPFPCHRVPTWAACSRRARITRWATDFYVPRRAGPRGWFGSWRSSSLTCVVASVALPPLVHAWESGQQSHEFSFMATLDGAPVRWNPCEPIHYVVNLGAAPAGSLQDVQDAVLRLSSATGIAFTYDGLTDEVPGAVPRRVPTRPLRRSLGARADRLGRSADEHVRFRSGRSRGRRRRRAAVSRPGAASTIYVSGVVAINVADPNPPGFAFAGGAGARRAARAGPRPGPRALQGPGRADGAIGWRHDRLRSRATSKGSASSDARRAASRPRRPAGAADRA